MPYSYAVYTGNGSTTQFNVPFPYIRREHIGVSINYVATTAFTWVNDSTLQMNVAPGIGARVEIRRTTPVNAPLVDFTNGSTLVAEDLDTNALQQTYVNQEQDDKIQDGVLSDGSGNLSAGGKRIANTADPVNPQDVATKNWVETAVTSPVAELRSIFYGAYSTDPLTDPYGNLPDVSDQYFNDVTLKVRIWNGTNWQDLSSETAITRWKKTAVGGELATGGADDNGALLNYTVGYEFVYLNGALLARGVDYTATNGNLITNLTALAASDVIEVISYSIYSIGSGAINSVTVTSPLESTGGPTPTISIQDGTTTQKGVVQLQNSTSSTSTTTAATPNSVKLAYDLASTAAAAVAAVPIATFSEFTTSGTWTKPSGALFVLVEAWGGGGGGGSGSRQASASTAFGGNGGSGGAYFYEFFKASDLPSTVSVTVGAGGTGGAAVTVDATNGNNGTNGGNTTFGSFLTAFGGDGGSGGSSSLSNGHGGAGALGRASGATGGNPTFLLSSGTAYSGVFGGGTSASTVSGTSSFGGGAGGLRSVTGTPVTGGGSVYGGAGGSGGTSINGSTTAINTAVSASQGFWGLSGVGGTSAALDAAAWKNVTFGNSQFVQTNGRWMATSSNGTSWSFSATDLPEDVDAVLYGNSVWVAWTTTGNVYSSTNLTSWTLRASAVLGTTRWMAYNGGTYVIVGTNGGIRTSTDLVTWTTRASGSTNNINHVIHDGTRWIACGGAAGTGEFWLSTDAVTWTRNTPAAWWEAYRIASNGSANFVVMTIMAGSLYYSTDTGATWTGGSPTISSGSLSSRVIFANSQFVITNGAGIWTTPTGATATSRTNPGTDSLVGLAFGASTFFASSFASNLNVGLSSSDAITWTNRTYTATGAAGGAGGNGAIACGGGGGGGSRNGFSSGAGGNGGAGLCRVYSW